MNRELWDKISAFDFDSPPCEYGFSTRLANEQNWTKAFTVLAIEEYKKFMYLAATSDLMVSPSETVDKVWHQHLIFTQSYRDFCNILGKQVQHIPSTHDKADFQKFKQAKERTTELYERDFGVQPKGIWGFHDMFDSLNLDRAKLKVRVFIIIGIFAFVGLTYPFYILLRPVYVHIDNPYFTIYFCALAIVTLLMLELYNRAKLKKIVAQFDESSFIYDLMPFELVYAQTRKLSKVIDGAVNEMVANGMLRVNSDSSIELIETDSASTDEQQQVIATLTETGANYYPQLMRDLLSKPIFGNTANCMDAFLKYFTRSKKFGRLFYTNFVVLSVLLLLSFTRIVTGVLRDKPAVYIIMVTIILTGIIVLFLQRLARQVCTTTLPNLYRYTILAGRQAEKSWQWIYFLSGTAVLSSVFLPLVNYVDRHNKGRGTCGSDCGSGCGSSCSSCGSCGGCGGCGGD